MSIPGVDLRVEIAFDSGFRTPEVDRTWTDVSDYVELKDALSITYGRTDEISVADANQLTLTLDNTDARFTYGNASSPYYPNLKIGRPIRVTAIIDAVEYVRFTGYVNEWPTEWPSGGEEYSTASISASSRLSRLGLDSPIAAPIDRAITSLQPTLYWPLDDGVTSTNGHEWSGGVTLDRVFYDGEVTAVATFGAGLDEEIPAELLALDARAAVKIESLASPSFGLRATIPNPVSIDAVTAGGVTVSFFYKQLDPGPAAFGLRFARFGAAVLDTNGVQLSGPIADWPSSLHESDAICHLAVTLEHNGGGFIQTKTYFNGVLSDTASTGVIPVTFSDLILLGPHLASSSDYRPALFARAAVWDRALTADEIATVGLGYNLYDGDTTDERLASYASWARIPAAEVTSTPSPVTLSALGVDGAQIVDLMRQVETAEAGVLHDNRDGDLVLLPRSARYGVAVGLTLDASAERVGADYAPKVDRQGLANVARGTNTAGTVEVSYTNEASREEYGDAAYDVETAALYDAEPFHLISWQVNANAEPRPRAPSVTLDVLGWIDEPDLDDVLNADIGTKVRVANAPSQAPEVTADYFAEGYTETFGEANWSISLNLSPVAPYDDVLVLDSATDGLLDTDVLAL